MTTRLQKLERLARNLALFIVQDIYSDEGEIINELTEALKHVDNAEKKIREQSDDDPD